ncbi:MAG: hypothetical protein IJL92_08520 [Thermoguttaceae bacterium]|nr:hypothetical protein [Thermoguttaceae bacterium]
MGSASKDYTTPSWLFIIAAISFVVDVFLGVAFTARDIAFFDAVDDSLFHVIITSCGLWWMAQIFVEPLLLLSSFSGYFSQGSKKSKLQLALAQLAIAITWIMCLCIIMIPVAAEIGILCQRGTENYAN